MVESDICVRCNEIENTKHMLWECSQVKEIWKIFNKFMTIIGSTINKVVTYEDIFKACTKSSINIIKLRIIKQLIQIERPKYWTEENMKLLIKETNEI